MLTYLVYSSCSHCSPGRCSTLGLHLMTFSLSLLSTWVPLSSSPESPASSMGANTDAVSTDESTSKQGLNQPALISIAAGVSAIVLLLILLAIFVILRHRRTRKLYPRPRAVPSNQ